MPHEVARVEIGVIGIRSYLSFPNAGVKAFLESIKTKAVSLWRLDFNVRVPVRIYKHGTNELS